MFLSRLYSAFNDCVILSKLKRQNKEDNRRDNARGMGTQPPSKLNEVVIC